MSQKIQEVLEAQTKDLSLLSNFVETIKLAVGEVFSEEGRVVILLPPPIIGSSTKVSGEHDMGDVNGNVLTSGMAVLAEVEHTDPEAEFAAREIPAVENEKNSEENIVKKAESDGPIKDVLFGSRDIRVYGKKGAGSEQNGEKFCAVELPQAAGEAATVADNKSSVVKIVFVESPEKIHIRKLHHEETWKNLQTMIQREGEAAEKMLASPAKGTSLLCLADGQYHRAVVKEAETAGFIRVKLVDTGSTVSVGVDDLRHISRRLKSQHCLTETVRLDLEPAGSAQDWLQSSIDILRRKYLRVGETVHVRTDVGSPGTVELIHFEKSVESPFDPEQVTEVNIGHYLLDQGLALKKGTRRRMSSRLSSAFTEKVDPLNDVEEEISYEPFESLDDEHEKPNYNIIPDILPPIPSQPTFGAILTHVDTKAVVWVVPREHSKMMSHVANKCLNVKMIEQNAEQGCLCVCKIDNNFVRGRILTVPDDLSCEIMDVDSGATHTCLRKDVFKMSQQLLKIPPLAIPIKLYGVMKTNHEISIEDFHNLTAGPCFGYVTVSVMEEKIATIPLPATVLYTRNGEDNAGNLAFFMLKKGFVRVITSLNDWTKEFQDHGLEWLLDPTQPPHQLQTLPFPLPLEAGVWTCLQVEGLQYPVDAQGREQEATITDANTNRVACRLQPNLTALTYNTMEMQINNSLRITRTQLLSLKEAFVNLQEKLEESSKYVSDIDQPTPGQHALALYEYESGGGEWCRATMKTVPDEGILCTAFFIDYGHLGVVKRNRIKLLDESLKREPVFYKDLWFEMPGDNCQLKSIRKEIKDSNEGLFIMAKINKIVSKRCSESHRHYVSFWKALEDDRVKGNFKMIQICA